jgi:TP901-1 family phage major tail protein
MAFAGRKVRIKIDGTAVAGARSDSFSQTREHIDITNKDDEAVRKFLSDALAVMSSSFSVSGILVDDTLAEWAADADEVLKEMQFEVDGLGEYEGMYGMTSFTIGGEHNGEATFEATFESGDEVTFTPVSVGGGGGGGS